jgi:Uri superfamily endonuclease
MKGVYVLVISVGKNVGINVGALGPMDFEKGLYAYVGSAQNGLEKRIERHLRKDKRKFWHIDYLLDNDSVKVVDVFCKEAGKPEECKIAEEISKIGIPIKKFASSDCKCKSHLIKLKITDYFQFSRTAFFFLMYKSHKLLRFTTN